MYRFPQPLFYSNIKEWFLLAACGNMWYFRQRLLSIKTFSAVCCFFYFWNVWRCSS